MRVSGKRLTERRDLRTKGVIHERPLLVYLQKNVNDSSKLCKEQDDLSTRSNERAVLWHWLEKSVALQFVNSIPLQ